MTLKLFLENTFPYILLYFLLIYLKMGRISFPCKIKEWLPIIIIIYMENICFLEIVRATNLCSFQSVYQDTVIYNVVHNKVFSGRQHSNTNLTINVASTNTFCPSPPQVCPLGNHLFHIACSIKLKGIANRKYNSKSESVIIRFFLYFLTFF